MKVVVMGGTKLEKALIVGLGNSLLQIDWALVRGLLSRGLSASDLPYCLLQCQIQEVSHL